MSNGASGWALGVISDNTVDMRVALTEEEFQTYRLSAAKIGALSSQFTFDLANRNYCDLKNLLQYLGIVIGLGRAIGSVDTKRITEPVMSQIVNWLTSVRLYLDHTETHLKRRYGDQSAEWKAFSESCSEAFDNHLGYRFVYKFRNYVQHCGLPLSSVTVKKPERPRSPQHLQEASFLLHRDALLTAYDEWGPVKKDLQGMAERFEVAPLLDEAMECLKRIEYRRLETAIASVADEAVVLREALDRIGEILEGNAALLAFTLGDDQSVLSLSPLPLPTKEALETLQRISAGEQDPASIIDSGSPPPPPLDPATVRDRLRVDSRGVQVLSLFLEQGGATTEFLSGIEEMVREDGDVRILVTGLVNTSITLLHAASAAIGATARGFLSGMLNIYPHFDNDETPERTESEQEE
jgi:hypothetical protein